MVHAYLDTTDLPVEHRFDAWTELATKAHVPTVVDSSHRANFVARIDSHELGIMRLSRLSQPPLRAQPPARSLRLPAEAVLITHVNHGRMTMSGPERVITADAGSIVVIDPFRPIVVANPVDTTHTVLQLPVEGLGLSRAQFDALSATAMSTRESLGGVLAHIADDLVQHCHSHEPAVVAQLTSTVIDLLGTAARLALRGETATATQMPARSRLLQIYAFMRQRLTDPGLTPEVVAAAHAISVRQLSRILEEDGESATGWIRRQRLDRCRRDLLDPALAARTVAAIGARWGFADPVTFNRAFRREFGMPPGEYRRRFTGL